MPSLVALLFYTKYSSNWLRFQTWKTVWKIQIFQSKFRLISSFVCLSVHLWRYEELTPNENKNNAISNLRIIKINIFHQTHSRLEQFHCEWLIQRSLNVIERVENYASMSLRKKSLLACRFYNTKTPLCFHFISINEIQITLNEPILFFFAIYEQMKQFSFYRSIFNSIHQFI